jgi:lipopolysaccharide transport system permease protein
MVLDALAAPFRILIRQRAAITTFVQREIRTRYATSAVGLGWAVLRPLSLLVLYTFFFSRVMGVKFGENAGTRDFVFNLFCGMVPWLAFSDGISRATTAISDQAQLVKRVRFPSEILPVHQVLVALAIESIGLLILLGGLIAAGRPPDWTLLTLGLVLLPQFLFTTGVAWILASVSVFLPDVRHFVTFALTFWLYGTPIFYPLSMVPDRFEWLFRLNPLTYLVEAYRAAVIEHHLPALAPFGTFCAVALVVFVAGYWIFQRFKYEFADVL